ncbi:hypothetical protein [Enorma shizhengliae]|uniref:Hemolysin activation protein n=1 Tax=Enorma shizhengliae TaxID=2606615 RepID=A0A7K0G911_9ACTN|nr:hypothetical protein [Enorma shizhengliae]MRX79689.1 hypothetical protein [Enorma shizhengliae]
MNPVIEIVDSPLEALVQVPVRVRIWIRPELQREQLECIRRERPNCLILVSDGGRTEAEKRLIAESRALFDDIDWQCEVHRLYWENNAGLYTSGSISSEYIWSKYDRCVFLEDDIMFSNGFLRFCADMLERYKNDERIMAVCGMNHEGVSDGPNADYFFSREASIWGTATWRRVNRQVLDFFNDCFSYEHARVMENARLNPDFRRRFKGYCANPEYEGHVPGTEFWRALYAFANNQLYIVPTRNMIINKGCGADSAHSDELSMLPRGMQRLFNAKAYDLEQPLVHPIFVIPDERYEKAVYRIMAVGHPLVRLYRKMARAWKIMRKRGVRSVARKIVSTFAHPKET